ncbi:hypothetical protein H4S04_003452 [Coemansia sp. S16]|nr:hypothetical protein H4S04_003452 [Coemansia sp. S16]
MIVLGEFAFDWTNKPSSIDTEVIGAIASYQRKKVVTRYEISSNYHTKWSRDVHTEMARNALSSLIGGIGYFHGSRAVPSNRKPEYGHEELEAKLSESYSLFAAMTSWLFFQIW